MDKYSVLEGDVASRRKGGSARDPLVPGSLIAINSREPLCFPGEDGGKSLVQMAERDLDATLQLLAERAKYITRASGAAIALREGEAILCRASAGPSAPELGASLKTESDLSGECLRTQQLLCCDHAATDPRVDRQNCQTLGIASALVMPLLRHQKVVGLFELLSDHPHAFGERDKAALQRLSEMVQTALDHAEASKGLRTIIAAHEGVLPSRPVSEATRSAEETPDVNPLPIPLEQASSLDQSSIGSCRICGFPISKQRSLCLDCENTLRPASSATAASSANETADSVVPHTFARAFSWLRIHKYLVGILLVAATTAGAVLYFR